MQPKGGRAVSGASLGFWQCPEAVWPCAVSGGAVSCCSRAEHEGPESWATGAARGGEARPGSLGRLASSCFPS
eukprot:15482806-Alexandrium_andersonii.AAC.1